MRIIDPNEAIRKRGRNPVEVERAWMLYELKQDPIIRGQLKQRIYQQLATMEQDAMRGIPADGQPNAQPVPTSNVPAGAQPGVSQGLPATNFVPPQPTPQQAAQPLPAPTSSPGAPSPTGTPTGAPAGVRGAPALHSPLPGE
jgi:predicted component of type VI protein secretion system